jgi:hypothetical protein
VPALTQLPPEQIVPAGQDVGAPLQQVA